MNAAALALSTLLHNLGRPDLPWLAGGALLSAALGLFIALRLREWRTHLDAGRPGLIVAITAAQLPWLIALLAWLGVRALLATAGLSTLLADTVTVLLVALILVRVGMQLLLRILGPHSGWLRGWRNELAAAIWVGVACQYLGWLEVIEHELDRVPLLPGKTRFTLWALLKGIVVISVCVIAASIVARAIERRVMRINNVAPSTLVGISKFTMFFLVSLGALLGINAAGVDLTALTVLTGAIGLGLGFGLQSIASNFVSGFVLLMDKSIKPGDVISISGVTGTTSEGFGWVQELRGRYVVVRDRDGVETLVPNQSLITSPVINWSYSDRKIRLKLPVRISYEDDPEVALSVLQRATEGNRRVLSEPAPVVRLIQFADYGMDLELRFWISDPQNGVNNVRSDVNRVIWRLFKEAGIKIPVAQREYRLLSPPDTSP
jgi:small-conductance mechanosensitive channel